jgi:two-component system, response regulator YesN
MISRTGEIMMSTAGERSLPEGMENAIAGESGSSVFSSAGRSYMLSYTTGQDGWKIVSLVPEDVVFGRVNEIKMLALILLALALIAGAGAAYWMAYRSYSPLRDIVAALRRDRAAEEQTGANEYEFIRTAIDRTMLEERESKQKLAEMMPVARAHFLSRLLKGQAASSDLRTEALQLNGLDFPDPYLYVIVIELEENGRFQVEANEHDRVLARFILLNVAVEICAGHGYVTETERNRFVLLLGAATRDAAHEQRDSLIATMKRYMEERFQMKLAMATSSVREGLGEAPDCYGEALQALDYRILHDARTVIHFEELQHREETIYFYPVELEVRMINLLKSGDYEETAAILDQLYEQNILSRGVTPELGKFLFFDMLSTLLKVIHALQIDGRQWFDGSDRDPMKWIASSHSSEETMGRIKQLCREMCDYVLEARIDPSARLKERMREYIDRNFADSALSLNSIADQFGMTPSYISGIFKKQFGINLSDYLVQLRVDRAKRHLADSEMTIQQIAESVGYTTDIGFIRAFKKIEGVPPGKYRETLLQAGYLKSD